MPERNLALADLVFKVLVERSLRDGGGECRSVGEWCAELALGEEEREVEGQDIGVVLSEDVPWPGLAKLFAEGYHARAGALSEPERPAFHASMAAHIRWIEDHTPHSLRATVDSLAAAEDRGWIKEVAAADLASLHPEAFEGSSPWLLPDLLAFASPTDPSTDRRTDSRVRRLLEEPEHRFNVLRRLTGADLNPVALCSVARSPVLFQKDGLCIRLLTDGDSAQVSLALYALRARAKAEPPVGSAFSRRMARRSWDEALPRLWEVHAQACLEPTSFVTLRQAIVKLVARTLLTDEDGAKLSDLIQGMASTTGQLRRVFLLAELADMLERPRPDLSAHLRERVLAVFLRSLTPDGIGHQHFDELFESRVAATLAARMEADEAAVSDLLVIGAQISERIASIDPETPPAILTAIHRALLSVSWKSARLSWCRSPGSRPGMLQYAALAQLAGGPSKAALPSLDFELLSELIETKQGEAFGAHDLYRLAHGDTGEGTLIDKTPVAPAETAAAATPSDTSAADVAEATSTGEQVASTDPDPEASALALPGEEAEPRLSAPAEEQAPPAAAEDGVLRVPAWPVASSSPVVALLRLYTGLDALLGLCLLPLRALGYRREGQLTLEDGELRLQEAAHIVGRKLRTRQQGFEVSEVKSVRTSPSPTLVYRLFGWGLLVAGAVSGVSVLFDGLRGARADVAALGVGIVVLGLLLDGVCHRAWLDGVGRAMITVVPRNGGQPLSCRVDGEAASTLMERLQTGR